jgi:hypothetical protein
VPTVDLSFLAHQGSQAPNILEGLLREIEKTEPGWRTGATVFLPRYVPSTSRSYLASFNSHSAYSLADPETHRLDVPFADRGRGRHELAYLQESDPVANRERFVENVLQAELDAGASTLISPWLTHGTSVSTRPLRATLRFAELAASHRVSSDRPLLFGIAATELVIKGKDERDDLLDAIVELPDGDIYFRMQVTAPSSYAQYRDEEALFGLRRFVEGLAANGRKTLLPQFGLAGWLMAPYGAFNFGSGISASMQRFVMTSDGFGTQPLEWYFLPQLLGYVLRTEMLAISQVAGYVSCDCPYCSNLGFRPGSRWSSEDAGLHYLWWCAKLMNELRRPGVTPEKAVGDRIKAAQAFWTELQQARVPLDQRSEPRHLEAWSAVVA